MFDLADRIVPVDEEPVHGDLPDHLVDVGDEAALVLFVPLNAEREDLDEQRGVAADHFAELLIVAYLQMVRGDRPLGRQRVDGENQPDQVIDIFVDDLVELFAVLSEETVVSIAGSQSDDHDLAAYRGRVFRRYPDKRQLQVEILVK